MVFFKLISVLTVFFSQICLCWYIGSKRFWSSRSLLSLSRDFFEQWLYRCGWFVQINAISCSRSLRWKEILLYSCLWTLSLLSRPSCRPFLLLLLGWLLCEWFWNRLLGLLLLLVLLYRLVIDLDWQTIIHLLAWDSRLVYSVRCAECSGCITYICWCLYQGWLLETTTDACL